MRRDQCAACDVHVAALGCGVKNGGNACSAGSTKPDGVRDGPGADERAEDGAAEDSAEEDSAEDETSGGSAGDGVERDGVPAAEPSAERDGVPDAIGVPSASAMSAMSKRAPGAPSAACQRMPHTAHGALTGVRLAAAVASHDAARLTFLLHLLAQLAQVLPGLAADLLVGLALLGGLLGLQGALLLELCAH